MSYEIKSVSYPAVKPILEIEADALSDISDLTGMAEGSTCKVSSTTYVYDEVNGWAVAGSQGQELPAFPEENGAYTLTATVSASGTTLTWESTWPSGAVPE